MKKSVKITLIVAAVLVGLGLCIAVVGALMGGRISDLRNTYYDGKEWHHGAALDGSYTGGEIRVPAEDVTALSIDWVAGDVKIMVTDGEEIVVTEHIDRGIPAEYALQLEADNTLRIRYCGDIWGIAIDIPEKDLTVLLPRTVAENLTAVDLSGVSADFAVDKLTVRESFSFDTTSGKLKTEVLTATGAKADVNSVSGDIELDGSFREVKAGSTSGEIDLKLRNGPAAIEVSTVSGEVDVELSAGTGFTLDYSTVSGELEYDFPLTKSKDGKYVCGDGACRMEVGTTSGSLSVERLG